VEVQLQLESGVELEVDEDGLRRALSNLVLNALQAMPEGGFLHVETAVEGEQGVVRIRDTGVGIPDDIIDHLFEPFVTSGRQGGTGLGLAIVQKVVHDHQGAVEVGKPEGGGTIFTLRLPLRRQA
jgi:signal transduction histidine kinase